MVVKPGDRVRLGESARHAQFRGLCGVVKRVVRSRGVVVVLCENGKLYDADPETVEVLEGIDGGR